MQQNYIYMCHQNAQRYKNRWKDNSTSHSQNGLQRARSFVQIEADTYYNSSRQVRFSTYNQTLKITREPQQLPHVPFKLLNKLNIFVILKNLHL